MATQSKRVALRLRRKMRIRKRVNGTEARPRLSFFRSTKHVYAQVIDDNSGRTLVSINSFGEKLRAGVDSCTELGKKLAGLCEKANIKEVVFDKNGFTYHGRVKAFADGAREGGLKF